MKKTILVALVGILLLFSLNLSAQDAQSLYTKAAEANKADDKSAIRGHLKQLISLFKTQAPKGEDLFYAGMAAVELRDFDKGEKWLKAYIETEGEQSPVAMATLIGAYRWTKKYEKAIDLFARFIKRYGESAAIDTLHLGIPATVAAKLNYYIATGYLGNMEHSFPYFREALAAIGDNSKGWVKPMQLVNYHSWAATHINEEEGWEAANDYLVNTVKPIFYNDPAMDAKIRDRIVFNRLEHYIATEQYEKGVAELTDEEVESFKVDDISYRRVLHMQQRFRLYNQPAPELIVDSYFGEGPRSLSECLGNVVLLEFFWTGCHPCRKSFPLMKKLHAHYKDKSFYMFGLTPFLGTVVTKEGEIIKVENREHEIKLIQGFYEDFELPWSVIAANDKANAKNYAEMGVPMTVIIDKKGIIRRITTGYDPTLKKEYEIIDRLLAEE